MHPSAFADTVITLLLTTLKLLPSRSYNEPLCRDKEVIAQLFEWPWEAVARECEEFLGPMGYCGVQVSPPQEHIHGKEWWTRYQPVSYKLESRSGNRQEFQSMVRRCNDAGVNVVVDLVINHMSGHSSFGVGTGGSSYDGNLLNYSAVPYSESDFHQPYCEVADYQDAGNVRNCYIVSLNDLDGSKEYVRQKIGDYANELLGLGVNGFRIDAAKHMWPEDLANIQSRFSREPFIFHEVIDRGGEAIVASDYDHLGRVTEFKACDWLACIRNGDFNCLNGYGMGLMDTDRAVVFVDNHDNQRNNDALTYKEDYAYKLAVGFLLAHSYGFKRVMSSYYFDYYDQGPPSSWPNSANSNLTCGNGWVCEHRWSSIADLIKFSNKVKGMPVSNWQIKEGSLGFSRGKEGFFAMGNLDNVMFLTGLPDGDYCDVVHQCQHKITVSKGYAIFNKSQSNDPVAAICVGC